MTKSKCKSTTKKSPRAKGIGELSIVSTSPKEERQASLLRKRSSSVIILVIEVVVVEVSKPQKYKAQTYSACNDRCEKMHGVKYIVIYRFGLPNKALLLSSYSTI